MTNLQAGSVVKTVIQSNLDNGYIEVQVTFPTPFIVSKTLGMPCVIADFLHPSVGTTDAKNCCTDSGLRDISQTGFIKVITLAKGTNVGDALTVYWQAWQ
jgi:hypothetical protein